MKTLTIDYYEYEEMKARLKELEDNHGKVEVSISLAFHREKMTKYYVSTNSENEIKEAINIIISRFENEIAILRKEIKELKKENQELKNRNIWQRLKNEN